MLQPSNLDHLSSLK